jgi:hypothetical protein
MDEKQIEKMIAMAAAKLGMTPDELKNSAKSGNVDAIFSKMDKASVEKAKAVLKDKKLTDELAEKFKKQ